MAYREIAPLTQFGGAIRCATTVVLRTTAMETSHHVTLEGSLPKERSGKTEVKGVNESSDSRNQQRNGNSNKNKNNVIATTKKPSTDSGSCGWSVAEGPSRTLWVARTSGDIDVRSGALPDDTLLGCARRKTRVTVTALLQIGHNRVAAGLSDGLLRVFDAVTLQECQELQAHSSSITCMISVMMPTAHRPHDTVGFPRASVLVTASSDSTIAKWDGVTFECLGRLKGHGCCVTALAANIGGVFVFSGAKDGSMRMWSLVDNQQVVGKPIATEKKVSKKSKKANEKDSVAPSKQQEQRQKESGRKSLCVGGDARATATPTPRTARRSCVKVVKRNAPVQLTPLTPLLEPTKSSATRPRASSVSFKEGRTDSLNLNVKRRTTPSIRLDTWASVFIPKGSARAGKKPKGGGVQHGKDAEAEEEDSKVVVSSHRGDSSAFDITTTPSLDERGHSSGQISGEPKVSQGTSQVQKESKLAALQFDVVFEQLMRAVGDAPIGRRLAATHACENEKDGGVLLWPLRYEYRQAVTSMVLVWDRLLVSASHDGVAKMFALPSGRLIRTVQRGHIPLTGAAVDEARCLLWISSADGSFSVYNLLQPGMVQVHSWQDPSVSQPFLVPLPEHGTLSQLYVFTKPVGGKKLLESHFNKKGTPTTITTNKNNVSSGKGRAAVSHEHQVPGTEGYGVKSLPRGGAPRGAPASAAATLTCIQIAAAGGSGSGAVKAMEQYLSLDKDLMKLRALITRGGSRDAVFRRILRRPVSQNCDELSEFLAKEKLNGTTALHFAHARFSLLQMYCQWRLWATRRASRHQLEQKASLLSSIHQEKLLSHYFWRWSRWISANRKLLQNETLTKLEARASAPPPVFVEKDGLRRIVGKFQDSLSRARSWGLLQQYYKNWSRYLREARCNRVQSMAFNRLMLSFLPARLEDTTFMWQRLSDAAKVARRHQHALWLLQQRMDFHHRQQLRRYIEKWIMFVRKQKETRQSLFLVETLSSVLVNEASLRACTFLKWYRFALFEAKLQRLEEEETMMKREWIVVQNAVDSHASVAELRKEAEELEVTIAELAFERDEVCSRNNVLRSAIKYSNLQKSLDCLLSGYRDAPEHARGGRCGSYSTPKLRTSNNFNRDRMAVFFDEEFVSGDAMTMRQVGALLRALKATALQTGRYQSIITAVYKRVAQLSIHDAPLEDSEENSSVSFSSFGGELPTLRTVPFVQALDGRMSAEWQRNCGNPITTSTCLADCFDRSVQRLQILLADAARQTGVDLDESHGLLLPSSVMGHLDKSKRSGNSNDNNTKSEDDNICNKNINGDSDDSKIDLTLLHWLKFVPASTRTEVLPLIVELVVMFDSVKAHSDTEVEAGGRTISTRGATRTVPLLLRSLCKPQTAAWLLQNALLLLELMSPGVWKRHLKLQALANEVLSANGAVAEGADDGKSSRRMSSSCSTEPMKRADGAPDKIYPSTDFGSHETYEVKLSQPRPSLNLSVEELIGQPRKSRALSLCAPMQRKPNTQEKHLPSSSSWNNFQAPGQRKGAPSGKRPTTAPAQGRDDSAVEESIGRCAQTLISSPRPCSNLSTPTKSMHSTVTTRPYLGFRVAVGRDDRGRTILTVQEVTQSYMKSGDSSVVEEGPASAAGLCAGDQLVRFAGYVVTELAAFNTVVARHVRPSASIPVVFSRKGELMSTNIIVGEKVRGDVC